LIRGSIIRYLSIPTARLSSEHEVSPLGRLYPASLAEEIEFRIICLNNRGNDLNIDVFRRRGNVSDGFNGLCNGPRYLNLDADSTRFLPHGRRRDPAHTPFFTISADSAFGIHCMIAARDLALKLLPRDEQRGIAAKLREFDLYEEANRDRVEFRPLPSYPRA
jgi:hypothetical protein